MRLTICAVILALFAANDVSAQRRKPQPKRPAPKEVTKPPASKLIGSAVVITTKNGDLIKGQLLDLNTFSIKIRSENLESSIALETIAAISFGTSPQASIQQVKHLSAPTPELGRDLDIVLKSVDTISSSIRSGTDYTEYGRLLSDMRRHAEKFIDKYSASDNTTETKAVALISGALTDYSWARTIWTLKLGRSGEGTVSETDSPVIADTLVLYPEMRTAAATGNRLSGDKLIGGLWKEAAKKIERARTLLK